MNALTWNDGMGSRSRRAWLLLVCDATDSIVAFNGDTIPGYCVVAGHDSVKAGKWSSTTYRIVLAPGVRPIAGHNGWETGRVVEGLADAVKASKTPDTWEEVAELLGVSVPATMEFLRAWRPRAAEALDTVRAQLDSLDSLGDAEAERVVVRFGHPSRRAIREGFWASPKPIPQRPGAALRLVAEDGDWELGNVEVAGAVGEVLSVEWTAGMHGGYVSVSVALAPAE